MLADIILTLAGIGLPVAFLIIAWHYASPMGFSTATLTFGILAALGTGQIVPMFGAEVVGGSSYLPAVFLCIAMCDKRYGTAVALSMLNCISRGMVIFSLAQFRGVFYALLWPELNVHTYAELTVAGRNAVLITGVIYLGGLLILSLRQKLEKFNIHSRLLVPVIVDLFLIAPVSLWAAYSLTLPVEGPHVPWAEVVFFSYVARLLVPAFVITYIARTNNWDATLIEIKNKPRE